MHRQYGTQTQQKLVKVITGKFNVRVVLTPDVKNHDNYLSEATLVKNEGDYTVVHYDNVNFESNPIMIPAGALLGYVSLENDSKMLYMADNDFKADEDDGFSPTSLNIDWGYPIENTVMSLRDEESPLIK